MLGISAPRAYAGSAATSARVVGFVDLGTGVDLSRTRFLRLGFDQTAPREIDLAAAADPAAVTLAEIVAAINDASGPSVASDQGGRLAIASPTAGLSSMCGL